MQQLLIFALAAAVVLALLLVASKVGPKSLNPVKAEPFESGNPPKGDARYLYMELRDRGILVRYWDRPRLDDKIRITVGTEEENAVLLDALKQLIF